MNIKNTAFAAFIFVLIYNLLFFRTGFGIGTTLFLFFLNFYFFVTKEKEIKNLNLALLTSLISILFASFFAFRANTIVQFIDIFAAVFFALSSLYLYKYPSLPVFKILHFLFIPFRVIEKSLGGIFSSFKEKRSSDFDTKNTYAPLIRGVLITLPIFIILLLILTQADPIFSKFTQDFFKNFGERAIISAILFTSLLSLGLTKFFYKEHPETKSSISQGKSYELSIITGSILGLFAVFIIVQFRYLFAGAGERELHELGIKSLTYSEYVRKGFFELLIAASIASGVIIYIFKFLHNLKGRDKQLIQIFSSILTIETGLLLLSAVKRVALYADAHGLTRARVFGFIFLVWLALLLIIFLIKIFKELKDKEFFISTSLITLATLTLINIINIDSLIAQKYKPTVNGEIDYYYLSSLSADAANSWTDGIKDTEKIVIQLENKSELTAEDNRKLYWANATIFQLRQKIENLLEKNTKWQTFNFSNYQAYVLVSNNKQEFDKITSLSNRIVTLQSKVSEEVQRNTRLDRSTNPPLLP